MYGWMHPTSSLAWQLRIYRWSNHTKTIRRNEIHGIASIEAEEAAASLVSE